MLYILGIITGILVSLVVLSATIYLRKDIEKTIKIIERNVPTKKEKGFIVDPPDPNDEIREEIIRKNKKKGKDTHIDELR